jgi:hydrogenase maturation factor
MNKPLGIGKVTRNVFNRCVLPFIPIEKEIKLDGAVKNLRGNTVIAHNPSIGVPLDALGFFAFHYSASNVACKFGIPRYIILGIYLPLKTTKEDLQFISRNLGDEAKKYGVSIIAGHTGTYFGIEIPLITTTCMGYELLTPREIQVGDLVLLVGQVGGEAVYLNMLSKNIKTEMWRDFTPLPVILSLQSIDGIKIMHDVSEGGVKGALYEIADSFQVGLNISSDNIKLYPEAEKLHDIFKAPTYGVFIVIVESSKLELVKEKCGEQRVPCSIIGEVSNRLGLIFDNQFIQGQKRTVINGLYGRF